MNGSRFSQSLPNDTWTKEYFWGCTLSKEKREVMWAAGKGDDDEEEDDDDYMQETLFVRHAVLGVNAVKDERNVVEIETKPFVGKDLVTQPIVSLTLGRNDMCQLDLNFSQDIPVKFRLVEGSGPVCLAAQHMVEFSSNSDDEFDTTEDDITDADESLVVPGKRKAQSVMAGKKKRGKLDTSTTKNGEDDEDEDDENEDDDEDEDDEMESDEADDEDDEDELDEEEDEDEEEEETPKKKAGKNKADKGKQNGSAKKAKKVAQQALPAKNKAGGKRAGKKGK